MVLDALLNLVNKMRVPIKITLTEENRRLETLVRGDVLIFPDRQETVKVIDKELGKLYNQRMAGKKEERVVYKLKKSEMDDPVINKNSKGEVYFP